MKKYINVDGNTAASNIAYYLSEAIEIYPITPSSNMAENADELATRGTPNIFGAPAVVKQLQSEAGVAGALHGSLQAGVLSTTFTSSQGLLLMLPNMLKIAGELLPTVFHVSARALATHALSIFGDHSDVMAVRASGFNMLCSASVQQAQDFALIAHIASIKTSLPFLHFFDGFRTSHEVQKIEEISKEDIKKIFPFDAVEKFKARRLDPTKPVQKGTAQNPDIFFQNREACNAAYSRVEAEVENAMRAVENITGRHYETVEYVGAKNAKFVLVMMGSGTETAEETILHLNKKGAKFGLIKIRLYRPFPVQKFLAKIPATAKKIAVLDRTKESGAIGEPLFVDVLSALQISGKNIKVIGGRYGLGGKEFTPRDVKAVFDNLANKNPKENFTVGINDDVSNLSLKVDENFNIENDVFAMKFYGLGSDGTVSANKNSIKIIGENTSHSVQGYFEYDSKKSGSMTVSHLRVSNAPIQSAYLVDKADFIAIHNYSFVARYDILSSLKNGGKVLLNTTLSAEELSKDLPASFVETLKNKNAKFYVINANQIAESVGLGNKINTIMQVAFFKISGVLEEEVYTNSLKTAIQKTYGRKGDAVVQMNISAVDMAQSEIVEIDVQTLQGRIHKKSKQTSDKYFLEVIEPINSLRGNDLPVSKFAPDGTVPTGTTKFEKRGIGEKCPAWKCENCIQCGLCVMACPHGAIRANLIDEKNLKSAPKDFETINATASDKLKYHLEISPLDCTGCGVCANVCPARQKALEMTPTKNVLQKYQKNIEFLKKVPLEKSIYPDFTPKSLQFTKPYFEFNYACPGCGETPYIKLATTLFGKNMVIANATGCSSIYGGSAPACPYTKDAEGCGPAWANSLFEDNAEFGFGIHLGLKIEKEKLLNFSKEFLKQSKITLLSKFVKEGFLSDEEKKILVEKLKPLQKNNILVKNILNLQSFFTKKSVWIVGGDGWAYDIGFGGLDHVLASGENVNILVLDTEVYSNTGGQSSKATPSGAYAKFAAGGKATAKKNLGAIAMTYPDVYVAQIALGANPVQAINAFKEAENHNGVSLIIAYAPCINHGFDMSNSYHEMKKAVETGYWNLYRRRPAHDGVEEEFLLDSTPSRDYEEFLNGENRYRALLKVNPVAAKALFEESKRDAHARRKFLENKKNNQKN
ncbi:MAG: pyruvate:ferredoxin (flavodoxin) oxidoreductase [Clostridia bacterium]|nr:pyruvate:ferredoxin (flavodoxin) oxidoreductase [Clostridia bacterium]